MRSCSPTFAFFLLTVPPVLPALYISLFEAVFQPSSNSATATSNEPPALVPGPSCHGVTTMVLHVVTARWPSHEETHQACLRPFSRHLAPPQSPFSSPPDHGHFLHCTSKLHRRHGLFPTLRFHAVNAASVQLRNRLLCPHRNISTVVSPWTSLHGPW